MRRFYTTDFENGGRDGELGTTSSLQKLEKARKEILPQHLQEEHNPANPFYFILKNIYVFIYLATLGPSCGIYNLLLQPTGFLYSRHVGCRACRLSRCGPWAQFPHRRSNLHLQHWKTDSQPPDHWRNPLIFKLYLVFVFFFGHALQHERSSFPDQELNLQPQQWKGRVLITGRSGKSLLTHFLCLTSRTIR